MNAFPAAAMQRVPFLIDNDRPAVLSAPMAGVSDQAYRLLCAEAGADLCYTEMVSAQGLAHKNHATADLLALAKDERSVAVQLFGHEPDVMAREAALVEDELGERLALIDINMGCSVRKVASKGDGCALMREPDLAVALVAAVAHAISCPVTAKLRRGWSAETPSAAELAPRLEAAGASALTVHGRFGAQGYRGRADWSSIAAVKAAVSIPVIGNGDIIDAESAQKRLRESGCDGIMIGRGAIGNPWVFTEIVASLKGKTSQERPSVMERLATARRHCELVFQLQPDHALRLRTILPRYFAGIPGASKARAAFYRCMDLDDFIGVIATLEERAEGSQTNRR